MVDVWADGGSEGSYQQEEIDELQGATSCVGVTLAGYMK